MYSYINSIGTAVPSHGFAQMQIAEFMAEALQLGEVDRRKLKALYRSTKIDRRHSVLADYGRCVGAYEFFPNTPGLEPFPSISRRRAAYRQHALPLTLGAVNNCFAKVTTLIPQQITHLITVSCTGMYAPGLDIELLTHLGLSAKVQRTAINFMGCYGAFNGLKIADALCKANPQAQVLLVCVELCTLHFQKKWQDDHLLANALFADGAAAVLVSAEANTHNSLKMSSFYCDILPESQQEMAWQVADFGFEMVLSTYIPKLLRQGISHLVNRLLQQENLHQADVAYYAIHPGGRAILEAIEQALAIDKTANQFAYEVLRQYGNMSSATVLFVLEQLQHSLQSSDADKKILSCAFGPGLTLESMLLEVMPSGTTRLPSTHCAV